MQGQNANVEESNNSMKIMIDGYSVQLNFAAEPLEDINTCVSNILMRSFAHSSKNDGQY